MRDAAALTAAGLLSRGISVLFSSFLSKSLGGEGLGVLHLVLSAVTFALSLASAGVYLSSVRLTVAAKARGASARAALKLCLIYSLAPGAISFAALFFGADACAALLGYPETAVCMRIFAPALPFAALSSALSGFFTAERKTSLFAAVGLLEQLLAALISMAAVFFYRGADPLFACLATFAARAFCAVLAFIASLFLYFRVRPARDGAQKTPTRELLKIALPDSVSSCLRAFLVAGRQLLIPKAFARGGIPPASGIAAYGAVTGMALPVVYFAACLSSAAASLLVPEIAEMKSSGREKTAATYAKKALFLTFVYAVLVSAAVYISAPLVASVLFPKTDAAFYIRLLAPIIPVSYADTTTDSILKGLGLQLDSMFFNIAEAVLCLLMVVFLVPRLGIWGYICMIFAGEIFNFALSFSRLLPALSSAPRRRYKEHNYWEKLKSAHKHI